MEPLIGLVSRLQDIFVKVDASSEMLNLPQIVVVGTQSAGKSSIIERIVGRDFLPRGSGIVTRVPLILHLVNCPIDDQKRKEYEAPLHHDWAVFGAEYEDQVFTDFNDVCATIQEITDQKAGTNRGVFDSPIVLYIYSHKYVNLTLVDLPGLTAVSVGDQPKDIPTQIKNMVCKYIKNENSIILAVTPANIDIASSESLSLAEEFDSEQNRTFAVFTKLDIMDRGTNAYDVLTGKTLPVKLGIVGVVNRCEEDRNNSLEESEAFEKQFFDDKYPDIAYKNGCNYLTFKLSEVLKAKIFEVLPNLSDRVHGQIQKYEDELAGLGDVCEDPTMAALKGIESFTKSYKENTFSGQNFEFNVEKEAMSPAAEISKIFHDTFLTEINNVRPLKHTKLEKIELILRSTTGLNPHILPSSTAFSDLIKKEIEKFMKPSLKCSEQVHQKMMEAIGLTDVNPTFKRFPKFYNFIRTNVKSMLDKQLEETKITVGKQIKSHGAYINTRFPKFEQDSSKILADLLKLSVQKTINGVAQTSNGLIQPTEDFEIVLSSDHNPRLISRLIPAYFDSVRDIISDTIPKSIVYNMINTIHEEMTPQLHKAFREVKHPETMFGESSDVLNQRSRLKAKLEALDEASKVLDEMALN